MGRSYMGGVPPCLTCCNPVGVVFAALQAEDIELAKQRLQEALQCITK